jgi:integrase
MRGTLRKRGTTWTYQYDVPDRRPGREGKRRQITKGGFRTKKDAATALAEALATIDETAHVEPAKVTLREYVEGTWLPSLSARRTRTGAPMKPATVRHYERMARYYILPDLGGVRLRDLSTTDVQRLYTALRERVSESTTHHVHVALGKLLSDAVEDGLLARNPVQRLKKDRRPTTGKRAEMQVWSEAQVHAFLAAAEGDRLYALWRLALATGMRRGELLGLRWEDVDLDAGRLAVRRNLVAVDYDAVEGEPKSGRPRTVALGPDTVAVLRAHERRQRATVVPAEEAPSERMMWGEAWIDTGLVFTREDGTALHPQSLRHQLARLAKAAGVPVIRVHDLRHTAATHLLARGVPVKVVQEMLGHASATITQDLYGHVLPHMQDSAAAVADSFLAGSAVNPLSSRSAVAPVG